MDRVLAGERIDHYGTVRLRKDGTEISVSISLAPILDQSGKVVGVSKTARDLTGQRKAEEALAKNGGTAPPGAEDGSCRSAGGRYRARFQ